MTADPNPPTSPAPHPDPLVEEYSNVRSAMGHARSLAGLDRDLLQHVRHTMGVRCSQQSCPTCTTTPTGH